MMFRSFVGTVQKNYFEACNTYNSLYYPHLSSALSDAGGRGRSSGVEHNLAKVRVVSSNLIARSIVFPPVSDAAQSSGDGLECGHDPRLLRRIRASQDLAQPVAMIVLLA